MLVLQYFHRLPAEHDMERIRKRAAVGGPLWDNTPDLALKAFLMRERGRHGATGNAYSSLYLWQRTEGVADFVTGDRFRFVTDSFGRPEIETWVMLDARAGAAGEARSAWREEEEIPRDADLAALCARERDANRAIAAEKHVRTSIVAVDLRSWRLARFVVSADENRARENGTGFEVLYCATPGLASLPH
jgi:hypothetical protein